MLAKLNSGYLDGLSANLVEVEVSVHKGLRSFTIVGLADTAIKEAKERVSLALKSSGLKPPHLQNSKVLINLAPADIKKTGALYDLPIALGFVTASEQANFNFKNKLFFGELALDGSLKPIKGAFLFALLAKEKNYKEIIVPEQNRKEANLVNFYSNKNNSMAQPLKITGLSTLTEVLLYLQGKFSPNEKSEETLIPKINEVKKQGQIEYGWIKGQQKAKKALLIAAAGSHNLLLQGPPGAGKTLLAKSVLSILPQLEPEEVLELAKIYSLTGTLAQNQLILEQRPFRAPHHSASASSLIGGGSPKIRPGEITLSHRGILFLDEFPEFHRDVLEALRQPLEAGEITIQRASQTIAFPANFTLIAAANPCPCGHLDDPQKECTCLSSQVASYRRKLSGPLIDRIDLFAFANAVKYEELVEESDNQETAEALNLVKVARKIQKQRFQNENILTNSEMQLSQIKKYCPLGRASEEILKQWVNSGKLSARSYHKIIKISRTIADLEESPSITEKHIQEALSFRKPAD
ncbi:magnesium chelatase [bacterium (Candidatus Gribaldobacteria) CG23_combo_of_CG06-09_8_20_14_all_37_87_8]|uniref:Magnesium chelatase n=2 Tax=Candidatus Gribaldobacteria TaxID=2798536 RepID=A0A2G9ZHT0_9BACT|nr:MAG: hypothetical protein AUJ25_03210 [Parcubacteria group bacterium CG1_02_37_13]PIP31898.1 MAG: magnesium chelatase [bacterium (Candidatus Gribaldobacteria) CG23_combo_of_CG06-09_8_20_14_all_37_87_8]PIR90211.1 MAG: magnesium chelatase [bacterium (Candidatus Gribaldobacteria) CG10_big_fil_rev_8_21_14_0_10_37_21]